MSDRNLSILIHFGNPGDLMNCFYRLLNSVYSDDITAIYSSFNDHYFGYIGLSITALSLVKANECTCIHSDIAASRPCSAPLDCFLNTVRREVKHNH